MLSSSLALSLLAARVFWTGERDYFFLVWNLFLAWVPYAGTLALRWLHEKRVREPLARAVLPRVARLPAERALPRHGLHPSALSGRRAALVRRGHARVLRMGGRRARRGLAARRLADCAARGGAWAAAAFVPGRRARHGLRHLPRSLRAAQHVGRRDAAGHRPRAGAVAARASVRASARVDGHASPSGCSSWSRTSRADAHGRARTQLADSAKLSASPPPAKRGSKAARPSSRSAPTASDRGPVADEGERPSPSGVVGLLEREDLLPDRAARRDLEALANRREQLAHRRDLLPRLLRGCSSPDVHALPQLALVRCARARTIGIGVAQRIRGAPCTAARGCTRPRSGARGGPPARAARSPRPRRARSRRRCRRSRGRSPYRAHLRRRSCQHLVRHVE